MLFFKLMTPSACETSKALNFDMFLLGEDTELHFDLSFLSPPPPPPPIPHPPPVLLSLLFFTLHLNEFYSPTVLVKTSQWSQH